MWMAPVQAVLLPINDDLTSYAHETKVKLTKAGLRVEVDERTESLKRKVRDAQLGKIPLILTVGEKEKASGHFSVRTLDGQVKFGITEEHFLGTVLNHIRDRKIDTGIFTE